MKNIRSDKTQPGYNAWSGRGGTRTRDLTDVNRAL